MKKRGRPAKYKFSKDYLDHVKKHNRELVGYINPEHLTKWDYHNGATYLVRDRAGPYSKRRTVIRWVKDEPHPRGLRRRYVQTEKKAHAGGVWLIIDEDGRQVGA